MAVLKSSRGYWLPAPPEATAGLLEGLDHPPDEYAVPGIADAIAVRAVIPNKSVLVLYPVEPELAPVLLEQRLDVAVSDAAWVEDAALELRRSTPGRRLRLHLFVDTGHARTGASPSGAGRVLEAALRHADVLEVRGLMSHFCCSLRHGESPGLFMRQLGLQPDGSWTEEQLRQAAARLHANQVRRVHEVFERLAYQMEGQRGWGTSRRTPLRGKPARRHAATSNAVLNGEVEVFYDMVRVARALFEGLPGPGWAGRRPPPGGLLARAGCGKGVRAQAVKTLPGRPGSEWCLSYGCLLAPPGVAPPFLVRRPMRVALLSGLCHEHWLPYRRVLVPTARGAVAADALGDPYGTMAVLPSAAVLNGTRRLRPLAWSEGLEML